ncbi:hypothetical protein B0H14DRAFT_3498474 [Mycena olivaceomarginata]|nr:hypothetical protein B0H14DRAFT_3498474 [Mycena olivaceomarginata]
MSAWAPARASLRPRYRRKLPLSAGTTYVDDLILDDALVQEVIIRFPRSPQRTYALFHYCSLADRQTGSFPADCAGFLYYWTPQDKDRPPLKLGLEGSVRLRLTSDLSSFEAGEDLRLPTGAPLAALNLAQEVWFNSEAAVNHWPASAADSKQTWIYRLHTGSMILPPQRWQYCNATNPYLWGVVVNRYEEILALRSQILIGPTLRLGRLDDGIAEAVDILAPERDYFPRPPVTTRYSRGDVHRLGTSSDAQNCGMSATEVAFLLGREWSFRSACPRDFGPCSMLSCRNHRRPALGQRTFRALSDVRIARWGVLESGPCPLSNLFHRDSPWHASEAAYGFTIPPSLSEVVSHLGIVSNVFFKPPAQKIPSSPTYCRAFNLANSYYKARFRFK